MLVSVIIPVFNDPRLGECLDALARQSLPVEDFEVIVVDNGSEKPQRELVESYPFARWAEESTPGSFAARNTALPMVQGEILAFTDSDCVPDPEWLSTGVAAIRAAEKPINIAGGIRVFPAKEGAPTAVELLDMALAFDQELNVTDGGYAVTANLIAPPGAFERVGSFNQELLSGGDGEWCRRAGEAGIETVYVPESIVSHPARDSLAEVIRKRRRVIGGRYQRNRGRSLGGFLASVARNLFPNFKYYSRGRKKLASTGYGAWSAFRLAGMMTLVHYIGIFENLRLRLGAKAER